MKAVIQRVSHASVTVDGKICGQINQGFLVLLGVGLEDTENDCIRISGELLIVSQFTLYADCRKGNRPNFIQAGKPDDAERLYNFFTEYCKKSIENVQTGIFGADMKVELLNDGPFTVILE